MRLSRKEIMLSMITYSGDTVYAPSQFSLSLTNPLADFSMVAQTPVVTVAAGATGTATLNLGSINGFNARSPSRARGLRD